MKDIILIQLGFKTSAHTKLAMRPHGTDKTDWLYPLSDSKENWGITSPRQIACGYNYRMPKSTMMTGQSTKSKIGA
jgi:hypothetical protein